MASYKKMWKRPEWQKKRLVILERDKFTCQHCASKEDTLNIHHTFYDFVEYKNPWDYPDDTLITLCENCHKEEHSRWDNGHSYLYNTSEYDTPDGLTYGQCADFGLTIKICQDMNISDHTIEVLKDLYYYRQYHFPDENFNNRLRIEGYGNWIKSLFFISKNQIHEANKA